MTTFIEIDRRRGREPKLIGVTDDVGARGRVARCEHGICAAWKTPTGDVLLSRGDVVWVGPPGTSMVPNDEAFDELMSSALLRLEAGVQVPSLGSAEVRYADSSIAALLADHVDRVRAAMGDLARGELETAPPAGVAWLSVADEHGTHSAYVEWRERGQGLAVIAGPRAVSWDEAVEWARRHAQVAYTHHPDGDLRKHRFTVERT